MKRIIYLIACVVAACAALASCNKLNSSVEEPASPKTHTIRFVAGEPETRTAMEIDGGYAYFRWEEADADSIYVYENDTPGEVSAYLEDGLMMISATFPGEEAPESATYYAHVNSYNVDQCPGPDCYDGSADILVADPVNVIPEDGVLPLVFHREVAINKMTIKGLGPGETIAAVSISSDEDPEVSLSGIYSKDGWSDCDNDIYTFPDGIVSDSEGNAVIYFTCLPAEDVTLFVAVITDNGVREKYYDKTLSKPITFTKGAVKSFGVKLEYEEPVPDKVVVEHFSAPRKYAVPSGYNSTIRASDTDKNKGLVYMSGFDYSSGWTCSADTSYVSVFNGGIVLGGPAGEPGIIANSNMLADIPGDFFIRIYASWWGYLSDEDRIGALIVTYEDGSNEDGEASIDNEQDYLSYIENPDNKSYQASDFPRYKEFFFTRSESNTFTISVRAGVRLLIDKIEILYYEYDDEGGDIDGDGEDITIDGPEG